MRQVVAKGYAFVPEYLHPITFKRGTENTFQIIFVSQKVVRVLFSPANCTTGLCHAKKSPIEIYVDHDDQKKIVDIRSPCLRIRVEYADGLTLTWIEPNASQIFAKDLKKRAYVSNGSGDGGVYHYMNRSPDEVYCGLGERTGNLNLYGRRFRLEGFDSMGYDAEKTDPLYKHCPFYMTISRDSGIAYGLFYKNMSRTVFDLGAEIDAFWGTYRYYYADYGPLDYYLVFGPSAKAVLDGFVSLVGLPRSLPPRFSLGCLASSMGYAEADNAQENIEAFSDLCRLHDIPCDALHLSSGYTVNAHGERCVFTWNSRRFPDPKKLMAKLKSRGIHVIGNVKPWLLETHPQYERMKKYKGLVWDDETDGPAKVMQWSAEASTCASASFIDFTSRAGYNFWKESVKKSLLDYGISGCWNDNNEFTITDDTSTFAMEVPVDHSNTTAQAMEGFSTKLPKAAGQVGAPIQTLLMAQCSYEALQEWSPKLRPFIVTRSASPWCHQFAAQTWSGDNRTEWKTLKFNIPMGLSAGLSACPAGYGHDVGGFTGPKPSPELLQRWVQAGILNPRFCIHSWNSDNSVTEPWMYESALASIRRSMHFRMRLLPYLYALYVEFQRKAWPIMRPLFWQFQHDPKTFDLGFEYMLGSCMLVAPVWQEGALSRTVYLPTLLPAPSMGPTFKGAGPCTMGSQKALCNLKKKGLKSDETPVASNRSGWFYYHTHEYFLGGREVTVDAPIDADLPPVFIPEGGMLPLGRFMLHNGERPDSERVILLYPSPLGSGTSSRTETVLIDDDGATTGHLERQEYFEAIVWMETSCRSNDVKVGLNVIHAGYRPHYNQVWVTIATGDWRHRTIVVEAIDTTQKRFDNRGHLQIGIPLNAFLPKNQENSTIIAAWKDECHAMEKQET